MGLGSPVGSSVVSSVMSGHGSVDNVIRPPGITGFGVTTPTHAPSPSGSIVTPHRGTGFDAHASSSWLSMYSVTYAIVRTAPPMVLSYRIGPPGTPGRVRSVVSSVVSPSVSRSVVSSVVPVESTRSPPRAVPSTVAGEPHPTAAASASPANSASRLVMSDPSLPTYRIPPTAPVIHREVSAGQKGRDRRTGE
ncbi:hypothetical protein ACFQV2_25675 [Actinokineospora soli]|uniref:Uncharacterized protein n=1 Tax=Actinokineospora soli TaxID=1048753 RepID=A0ABW2TSR5_9PSEU